MTFTENPYHILLTDKDYFIRTPLEEYDTILDAGAYIGTFSVYAGKKIGSKGKVIAFEPDPDTFERLKKNLELNNASNVKVINRGLWSSETILVFEPGKDLGSSFIIGDSVNRSLKVEFPAALLRNKEKNKNSDLILSRLCRAEFH